jgi:hypothetical protein
VPAWPWAADVLLVVLRWLHTLAAVGFLGWVLVYLLDPVPHGTSGAASSRFKEVTELTLLIFLATGAVLTFDRLSRGAGTTYALVLALKVFSGVVAYQLAFRWRRGGLQSISRDGRLAFLFGSGAVLLAAILKGVFESGIRSEF